MTDKPRRNRRFSVDDLFTDTRPQATGVSDLAEAKVIELVRIEPDPEQPRRHFDADRLMELADAIKAEGVLQPIVVRYDADRDIYVIVHGERRFRASKLAGKAEIPAIIRDVPAQRRLVQQLMENIVRDDLNAIDRAAALRALREQMDDAPWEEVAAAVGIKRSRLFQLLGTEKLPEAAQEDIQSGKLSEKQSRALQGLPAAQQEALRALMVERGIQAATAMKIAQALKTYSESHSHTDAQEDVQRLYELLEPADLAALSSQTRTLLQAVQARQASELAKLLSVPRVDDQRLTKEVSALAKSLTRTETLSSDSRETLIALRDALDAILQDED
ncbi:MAG: ParB/RepB/Spo0J family partition protein [Thermomicrobiales bacterium]|nr:ParB/RepB/Spo0J family partition protein [Thermomicrobiales bacterium]